MATEGQFLEVIQPFAPERYKGFSTTDLMVYVADTLKSHKYRLTYEVLVVGAYKFFPEAFSLVGFPQYPDASRVNRTLLQCQPKYRNLMRGSASTQYILTELGIERAIEIAQRLAGDRTGASSSRRSRPRAMLDRIEQELRNSSAFSSWQAHEQISDYDFYHLLHLVPGSSMTSVRENYGAISGVARESHDPKLQDFLSAVEAQFKKELVL